MCGILGASLKSSLETSVIKAFTSIQKKMSHRGPDAFTQFVSKNVVLGHNRLSIIDVEEGSQPFKKNDSSLVLVFNGEIYNYKDIRAELKRLKATFSTNSDTEVLYEAWRIWGPQCVDRLRGMFAFAFYDIHSGEIFLARDVFGIKPLYYSFNNKGLFFASEFKSTLAMSGEGLEIDEDGLIDFLLYQFVDGEKTLDQRVKKIKPGQVVRFHGNSKSVIYNASKTLISNNDSTNDFIEVLKGSVQAHTISDVGFGVLLSGGLDSTSVAKILRDCGHDFETYSLDFEDERYSELSYIEHAAKILKVKNKILKVSLKDFTEVYLMLPDLLDEPLGDSSFIPTYIVSRFIAAEHKVALSGDGGDELLGGYRSYHRLLRSTFKSRLKVMLKDRSFQSISSPLWTQHLIDRQFVSKSEITKILGRNIPSKQKPEGMEAVYAAMEDDVNHYMCNDILQKVDRASMKCSLEVRVPFIDRSVYAAARKLSKSDLFGDQYLDLKLPLKKFLVGDFGINFVDRKKMGFGLPFYNWTRDVFGDDVVAILKSSQILLRIKNQNYFWKQVGDYLKGDNRPANLVWGSLMLVFWEQGMAKIPRLIHHKSDYKDL